MLAWFLLACSLMLGMPQTIHAMYPVLVPENGSLFEFDILEMGESVEFDYLNYDSAIFTAAGPITDRDVREIMAGAEYWSTVLGPDAANVRPVRFIVFNGNVAGMGAIATSEFAHDTGRTLVGESIIDGIDRDMIHGEIRLGNETWGYSGLQPLGMDGDNMGLASIVLHEMAHTLGLLANVGKSDEQGLLAFPEYIPVYTSHLYDALGNRARPGMPIYLVQDLPSGEETTSGFYLQGSSDNPYPLYTGLHFRGKNVTEAKVPASHFPKAPSPSLATPLGVQWTACPSTALRMGTPNSAISSCRTA